MICNFSKNLDFFKKSARNNTEIKGGKYKVGQMAYSKYLFWTRSFPCVLLIDKQNAPNTYFLKMSMQTEPVI